MIIKKIIVVLLSVTLLFATCSPIAVSADSGYGRTVDPDKLNNGADSGIVGAWMCIWDESMNKPPWIDYFYADGTWDEVYWESDYSEEPLYYSYKPRTWELSGSVLIRYGRYGGSEETFRNRTDKHGYTELTRHDTSWDFRYIALTDEGYNTLKNYKASDWKNFDYINLCKKANVKVPATSISHLFRSKKAFTAKWKRKSGINGYQIQYCTRSDFRNAKVVTVSKPAAVTKKIKKLKKNKKYYVRIRTYKKVNGNTYYSAWSKKKSVRTK